MLNIKSLKYISQEEAILKANEKIRKAMEEEFPGLYSRWPVINRMMGGCWRFGEVTYICGLSGHGKSYFLNMLRQDFCTKKLNQYPRPYKILTFTFEMGADDEMIRTYSSRTGLSYSELMSAEDKITASQFEAIKLTSEDLINDICYYVETSGNRIEIMNTIDKFQKEFPEHQLIIMFDHTLLMNYYDEQNEVDLINRLSRLAIEVKKRYGAMIILLGQLNTEIEKEERRSSFETKRYLHYPTKMDIHSGKSVYMASDNIMVIHRPELLYIDKYGTKGYDTKDLVAIHWLKGRLTGSLGVIRFKQAFAKGDLIYPYEEEEKEGFKI